MSLWEVVDRHEKKTMYMTTLEKMEGIVNVLGKRKSPNNDRKEDDQGILDRNEERKQAVG